MFLKRLRNVNLIAVGIFLSLAYVGVTPLHAIKGTTTVSYECRETITYLLTVSVKGEGSVFDGEEMIRGQISEYQLKIDSFKLFRVKPDKGNELEKIMLDGKDITKELQGDVLKVEGKEANQNLEFYFSEGEVAGVDSDQNTSKPGKPSKTDDSTKYQSYILGLLGSILLGAMIYKKGQERSFKKGE